MSLLSKFFKKRSKKRSRAVGTVPTQEKQEVEQSFPEVKPVESTNDLLKEWSKTLEMVEKHPLSQARVINTGILNDLTRILHSMDEKLGGLVKLDEIIHLLMETKSQLTSAGLSTNKIDTVIGSLKGLTLKDQEALKVFNKDDSLTTETFAEKAGLSRSTASSRLNKLFSLGLLEKVAQGKKVAYKLKQ